MSNPVCSMVNIKPITILAGATGLSDVIDVDGYKLLALEMPSTWAAADITFQACSTIDGTYLDVYDDAGIEVSIKVSASKMVVMSFNTLNIAPLRFIKFRSGTTALPVNQTATRVIKVLLKS